MSTVQAPVAGTVRALPGVSDPVFAAEMVGSGAAVEPRPEKQQVTSPMDGTLVKVLPHAFIVHDGTAGVLVHIGIDTVTLRGEGFDVLVEEKQQVTAGQPVVGWEPQVAVDHEMDTVVLVCQMETAPGAITPEGVDTEVEQGDPLFTTV